MTIVSWEFESPSLHFSIFIFFHAEIAQLVEHNLAKVGVASSSLVFRSWKFIVRWVSFFCIYYTQHEYSDRGKFYSRLNIGGENFVLYGKR